LANILSLYCFLRILSIVRFMILKELSRKCVSLFSYQCSFCFALVFSALCILAHRFCLVKKFFNFFYFLF